MNHNNLLNSIYAQRTEDEFVVEDKGITLEMFREAARELGPNYKMTFCRVGDITRISVRKVNSKSCLCYWVAGISTMLLVWEVFF